MNSNGPDDNGEQQPILDVITDSLTTGSLSGAILKNALKAICRLSSAVIEIPIAHMEGKASLTRAEYANRIKLIHITGDQIAIQMRIDPEYARRAGNQFGQKIIREQVNLDTITERAIQEVQKLDVETDSPSSESSNNNEISDEWFDHFESQARYKSSPELQTYFSKVLAGEIRKPNSFSIRSLRILGDLDQNTSEIFQRLCSACIVLKDDYADDVLDARVPLLGGKAGGNALRDYGLDFLTLTVLNEYGLIIPDFNSWRNYSRVIGKGIPETNTVIRCPFVHQNKYWVLESTEQFELKPEFKIPGVALTNSGCQLLKVVQLIEMEQYTRDLIDFFKESNLLMTEIREKRWHEIILNK